MTNEKSDAEMSSSEPELPVPLLRALVPDGALLCDRFRVHNALGIPGTRAFAVRATDEFTGEEIVCKVPCRAEDGLFKSLLEQYLFLRKLKSPRLPSPLGFFRFQPTPASVAFPFLVMEWVRGEPADFWFPRRSILERLRMFLDVVEAVAGLNDEGVSHGDVHLGNVLVGDKGSAVLIDPESELYGSTVQNRTKIEGSIDDMRGLKGCLEQLLTDANPHVGRGLQERLGQDDLKLPTARELAVALRSLLASPRLPGEGLETIEESASRYKTSRDAKLLTYRTNRQLRDLEFRKLRDAVLPIAEKYGLKVEVSPDSGPYGLDSPVTNEEKSESGPHGTFVARSLTCQNDEGDKLHVGFQRESEFRRPWPAEPGLLSKGYLNVVIEGVSPAVLVNSLELWLREEAPTLIIPQPHRELSVGTEVLARAFRVLAGDIYPGVSRPLTMEPRGDTSIYVSQLKAYDRIFDTLGIPRPSVPNPDFTEPQTPRRDTLGFGLLRMALTLFPNHNLLNGKMGSSFRTLVRLPTAKRYEFVTKETEALAAQLRDHLNCIYQFDVRVDETTGPKLSFDIDAIMDQVPFKCTIQVDYTTDPGSGTIAFRSE